MINRTVHMIFEPSGQAIPSEEEVQFEAQEIVSRFGWGLPLLEALRKVRGHDELQGVAHDQHYRDLHTGRRQHEDDDYD
jgi:hypothetical protein